TDDISIEERAYRVEIHLRIFCNDMLGLILNKVVDKGLPQALASKVSKAGKTLTILGSVPHNADLQAPRTYDVARMLNAKIINEGKSKKRRVKNIVLCARALVNTVELMQQIGRASGRG